MMWMYQVILLLAGPSYLLVRILRGRPVPGLKQRLGWYSQEIKQALHELKRPIWIHLVSVGEVIAAEPLIQELRRRFPHAGWVITTTTATGQQVARRMIRGPQDRLLYLPWDFGPVVNRAIRVIKPRLFLTFETELWPVLFKRLHAGGVPIVVVNGRISPAAYRRYLWIRPFMRRVLDSVDLLFTQSPQDARRYAAIGAPKDRIVVAGNLKWDLERIVNGNKSDLPREFFGLTAELILWTAGSTHPGEERSILQVYRRLKSRYPHLRLLIAPRHPERIPAVEQEVAEAGYVALRRSTLNERIGEWEDRRIVLLDTVGELTSFYKISDLVFVGGSLVPHGGHNLVEPAALRRPILAGPHLGNFQAVAESLIQAGGVAVVRSTEELEEKVQRLIEDPAIRQELGRRAYGVIEEHRGATERTVEGILLRWGKQLESTPCLF